MGRSQTDKRKKWHKARCHRKPLQRVNSVGYDDITALLDTDATCTESMNVAEFPSIVKEAAQEENVLVQTAVLNACLWRMLHCMDPESGPREPRLEQVRVLRRLIFGKGDTLLVARIGFGKSIIFHSFSVLTGKIAKAAAKQQAASNQQAPQPAPITAITLQNIGYPWLRWIRMYAV